jgi:hypothetical protein
VPRCLRFPAQVQIPDRIWLISNSEGDFISLPPGTGHGGRVRRERSSATLFRPELDRRRSCRAAMELREIGDTRRMRVPIEAIEQAPVDHPASQDHRSGIDRCRPKRCHRARRLSVCFRLTLRLTWLEMPPAPGVLGGLRALLVDRAARTPSRALDAARRHSSARTSGSAHRCPSSGLSASGLGAAGRARAP